VSRPDKISAADVSGGCEVKLEPALGSRKSISGGGADSAQSCDCHALLCWCCLSIGSAVMLRILIFVCLWLFCFCTDAAQISSICQEAGMHAVLQEPCTPSCPRISTRAIGPL